MEKPDGLQRLQTRKQSSKGREGSDLQLAGAWLASVGECRDLGSREGIILSSSGPVFWLLTCAPPGFIEMLCSVLFLPLLRANGTVTCSHQWLF